MKEQHLYEPSLTPETVRGTRSYPLGNLAYVAFFGGTLALLVLAVRNGRWLRVKPAALIALTVLGLLILAGKFVFYGLYAHNVIHLDRQYAKYIGRAADLLLFGAFYAVMVKKYREHQVLAGHTEPLLKSGLLWVVLSFVFEIIGHSAAYALF